MTAENISNSPRRYESSTVFEDRDPHSPSRIVSEFRADRD
jgi:hypothetical protein